MSSQSSATTDRLVSTCPATGQVVWDGPIADAVAVAATVDAARAALPSWSACPLATRIALAEAFAERLRAEAEPLAALIARETGKPAWETRTEVAGMAAKVAVSIRAQAERAGTRTAATDFGTARLTHHAHGVMAVLGPYNFPGHLPNGHIVPALLAGNTVVFKPSEETPATGAFMARLWAEAGLPDGVLGVVQGGRATGEALVAADIDGLLFTGSAATGAALRRAMVDRPGVIVALELGGNNPLVAWDGDPAMLASIIVLSAFITSGQRCSCARRLIVPAGPQGDAIVAATLALASRLRVGAWDAVPEPAFGPLVSDAAADRVRSQIAAMIAAGARPILPLADLPGRRAAFINPVILDVTGVTVPDAEIFGPVLQILRVADFDAAITAANATAYGLSAGLLSADAALWEAFCHRVRAGVINWNRPTTGAAADLPFGGLGDSGNHRPSAYYAADYCAYPVASFEAPAPADLTAQIRGLDA